MTDPDGRYLQVLRGRVMNPPPVWFMRQAGRYLPEYRKVRSEAGGFLDMCFDPRRATEVTLQPIERYDLDAAILFADILLVPIALGQRVWFEPGEGPKLSPAAAEGGLGFLDDARDTDEVLGPIYETVRRVRAALPKDKALIGFAGAPWTVATYMIAGGSSKDPSACRAFAYGDRDAFATLIDRLTEETITYLIAQVQAGANSVQIFDSWASGLPEPFFERYCREPVVRIAEAVKAATGVPVIAFPKGAGPLYERIAAASAIDAVSIDTGLPAEWAATHLSPLGVVQGGLDPLLVVHGGKQMLNAADSLLEAFADRPYIFNLGHGFVPQTPPENVAALVSHIRSR